ASTAFSRTRRSPASWPVAFIWTVASSGMATPTSATPTPAIPCGEPTPRCDSSSGSIRAWSCPSGPRRRLALRSRNWTSRRWVGGEGAGGATSAWFQKLDVAAVVRASQAVSGEIVLPKLIKTLMSIALQNAGADRGLLILTHGEAYRIEAEARTSGDHVEVGL